VPWDEVPEENKRLMIAVCEEILATLRSGPTSEQAQLGDT
jgi:hypothetical protein